MTQCIVTVLPLNRGYYVELDGSSGTVYGVYSSFGVPDTAYTDNQSEILRKCSIYSCSDTDAPALVTRLAREWVGHEIKTFNLAEISVLSTGEFVKKQVIPDGVIPF